MAFTFSMRRNSYIADTLELASKIYCRVRDESGEGNSTFPKPTVRNGRSIIGVFSYNGRIWSNDGANGQVLIYDNALPSFEEALQDPAKARALFDASKGGCVRGITEDHRFALADVFAPRGVEGARRGIIEALGGMYATPPYDNRVA